MATSRPGLGYPAIPPVRDQKGAAAAIANARQRIEAIEALLASVQSTATTSANSNAQQVGTLSQQINQLAEIVNAFSTDAATDTAPYTAGEALSVFQAVVPSSTGRVVSADPSNPLAMFGLIGITISTAALGEQVTVQRRGPVTIVGASFLDQRAVYATADGQLTQTPDYEATALPVGVAIDSTTLYVIPQWPALRGLPIESSVGDAFLRFLPVTYSLIADIRQLIDLLATQAPGPAIWTGADLTTNPITLPAEPSGGLNGTEIVLVERDGIWVHTTLSDIASFVIRQLSVSG